MVTNTDSNYFLPQFLAERENMVDRYYVMDPEAEELFNIYSPGVCLWRWDEVQALYPPRTALARKEELAPVPRARLSWTNPSRKTIHVLVARLARWKPLRTLCGSSAFTDWF
jgi:hypothetical protein